MPVGRGVSLSRSLTKLSSNRSWSFVLADLRRDFIFPVRERWDRNAGAIALRESKVPVVLDGKALVTR